MNQIHLIKKEFTKQSSNFNTFMTTNDKQQFNKVAIEHLNLNGSEEVLEVAAGTCAFGRMIAPCVKKIIELDTTEAMLEIGKKENEKVGIKNADYILGLAEELPFADQSFDVIVSRLAFHHFANPEVVFKEMVRVLKPNGKILIADMLARESNRTKADEYEQLRDPSHVVCLSLDEFNDLANKCNMLLKDCLVVKIPVNLSSWMKLTNVQLDINKKITFDMNNELNGGEKTGFEPYLENGEIMFVQHWGSLIYQRNH